MAFRDGKYYIYENVKTGKVHICKNKYVLEFELAYVEKKPISVAKLRDMYSIVGEIDTIDKPKITMYANDRIGEMFKNIFVRNLGS